MMKGVLVELAQSVNYWRNQSMKFVKIKENAKAPRRATYLSAGYDMYALNSGTVAAGSRALIETGIGWDCGEDDAIVGFIKPRSGLAYKHGIQVMAGVIDADYPSDQDIGVILFNTSDETFEYEAGDAIAQLVVLQFWLTEDDVAVHEELERIGGLGSTGK
jgi:dUTP pyrophosphatase